MHLVFSREDKSTTLSYELEPFTLITLKVKDETVIKKETKKGKPALKKAKVKEECTPQIKVCLLLYKHVIILNICRRSHSGLKLQNFIVLKMSFGLWKTLL
jgi:hypothetical protein